MENYGYRVFWSEQDRGYIAVCPEFPDLSAFGETAEEALAEMKIALELAIETYEDEGWPLPEPRARPSYSGQFRARLPKSLHAELASRAEEEGVSLNTLLIRYAAAGLGRAEAVEYRVEQHAKEFGERLPDMRRRAAK